MTNYHVIEEANRVDVLVNDSETYRATVLGYDASRDLAVLEICCGRFQVLTLKDSSSVKSGSEVIAIGYALSYSGPATVTRGIVSAVRWSSDHQSWVIQTDAPINPGNSGGPLLLATGEVIGINTFRDVRGDAQGLGFAIAEQSIKDVLSGLKQGTKAAFPTPTPIPTPTPAATQWKTYTNNVYGYNIRVPADWSISDNDKSAVNFDSPGDFAGVSIDAYPWQADLGDWVDQIIDGEREINKERFEVFSQRTDEKPNGTGTAFIIFIAQSSRQYCVGHIKILLVVTLARSYYVESFICEHAINEYAEIERSILFENFSIQ